MNRKKPTLAFKKHDPDIERAIANRLGRHATTLTAMAARHNDEALGEMAADLAAVANLLHPTSLNYATVNKGRAVWVALIDSFTIENVRLLPCAEARAFNFGRRETVYRSQVREWPTLPLALGFAKAMREVNQNISKTETRHRREMRPVTRRRDQVVARFNDRKSAVLQKRAAKA